MPAKFTLEQSKANLDKARAARGKPKKVKEGKPRLTPLAAIRAKCLDCMVGSSHEVELCVCPDCSLFEYRFGHRPTPEECLAVREIKVLRGK